MLLLPGAQEALTAHDAVPSKEPVTAEPEIIDAEIGPVNKVAPIIFPPEPETSKEPETVTLPKREISDEPVHFDEPPDDGAHDALTATEAVPNRLPVIPEEAEIIEAVIGPVNRLVPIILETVDDETFREPVIETVPKRLISVLPVHFDEPAPIPVS